MHWMTCISAGTTTPTTNRSVFPSLTSALRNKYGSLVSSCRARLLLKASCSFVSCVLLYLCVCVLVVFVFEYKARCRAESNVSPPTCITNETPQEARARNTPWTCHAYTAAMHDTIRWYEWQEKQHKRCNENSVYRRGERFARSTFSRWFSRSKRVLTFLSISTSYKCTTHNVYHFTYISHSRMHWALSQCTESTHIR